MDEALKQMLEQFEAGLRLKAVSVVRQISDETIVYPAELNKKQISKMFGIDPTTFDARFNCHKDFPRIETGGREKYPRDAALEWYNKNWMKTGV
ncbi:DNA-binding protein [Streptococcus uberis]|uniref:DNA-binding protein n=1 Tax=Streptococcus uberis TaxID=1349 RepID=UPI0019399BDB|nr:DNA-binding protein [Streptococcus uberis]